MNERLINLTKVLSEISVYSQSGDYNTAYRVAKSAVSDFPYSTEVLSTYLTLAQLSDQIDISLDEIKCQLSAIMELQNYSNLGTIVDNLSMRHNVLNEKSEDMEIIFQKGYNTLLRNTEEFLEIYQDYLSEIEQTDTIKTMKNEIIETITKI